MFWKKARSKAFWKEVKNNPQYRVFIDEVIRIYDEDAQGEIFDYADAVKN